MPNRELPVHSFSYSYEPRTVQEAEAVGRAMQAFFQFLQTMGHVYVRSPFSVWREWRHDTGGIRETITFRVCMDTTEEPGVTKLYPIPPAPITYGDNDAQPSANRSPDER